MDQALSFPTLFKEGRKMKDLMGCFQVCTLLIISFALAMFVGCDSGKKTIDQVTGNEAVKQYHKSKEDIDDIVDKQYERLNSISEDDIDE